MYQVSTIIYQLSDISDGGSVLRSRGPFAIRVTRLMHSPASTILPPAFVPDVVPVGSPGEKNIGGTAGPGLEVSTLQARNPRNLKHPNRTAPADTSENLIPTRRRQCLPL